MRLIPSISAEEEWEYLVGETLVGERMIVPALAKIVQDQRMPKNLRVLIEGQLQDEVRHLAAYRRFLGGKHVRGSRYDVRLGEYIKTLPTVTHKLFCLQGMLEGISLGALQHRLAHWHGWPATDFDREVLEDEETHVSLSFDHFAELSSQDGIVSFEDFRRMSSDVNEIFVRTFNGAVISQVIEGATGRWVDAAEVESSDTMKVFKRNSCREIVKNKNEFIKAYYEHVAS